MDSNIRSNWAKGLIGQAPLADWLANQQNQAAKAATTLAMPAGSLPRLHVGSGYRFGNLDWFPVWSDAPVASRNYTTAASAGAIKVSELTNAQVSGLKIENTGSTGVLLLEGTLLEGGKQHRALVRSVFVPANTAIEIPVVCVEEGRWAGPQNQNLGQKLAPARVRAAMRGMEKVSGKVEQRQADQGKVWSEIQNYHQVFGEQSRTASYAFLRDQIEAQLPSLDNPVALLGQRGVIIAIGGVPVAMELFDHPDTLSEKLDSILRGYLPDAMKRGYKQALAGTARKFADRIVQVGLTKQEGPNHKRNEPDLVVAAEALFMRDELVHLSALNARHSLVLAA